MPRGGVHVRTEFVFAAKLVRGAYMRREAEVAAADGCASPVCDTIEHTHSNYDSCMHEVRWNRAC